MPSDDPWPCVVLRHELPDGSSHLDWMLASKPGDSQTLITFRLDASPALLDSGARLSATRLADHRAIYLDYEGEVSGGRGFVQRQHRGTILHFDRRADARWSITIHWDSPAAAIQRFDLHQLENDRWIVICAGNQPHGSS